MNTPAALYTDGGCVLGNPSRYAAQWAYCHVNEHGIRIKKASGIILRSSTGRESAHPHVIVIVPAGEINPNGLTNQLSELVALTLGMESVPTGWSGLVYSDSESALDRMFNGMSMGGIPEEWQYRCKLARERIGDVTYTLLGGHPTKADLESGFRAARPGKRRLPCSHHQHWCDEECQRVGRRFVEIMHSHGIPTSTERT